MLRNPIYYRAEDEAAAIEAEVDAAVGADPAGVMNVTPVERSQRMFRAVVSRATIQTAEFEFEAWSDADTYAMAAGLSEEIADDQWGEPIDAGLTIDRIDSIDAVSGEEQGEVIEEADADIMTEDGQRRRARKLFRRGMMDWLGMGGSADEASAEQEMLGMQQTYLARMKSAKAQIERVIADMRTTDAQRLQPLLAEFQAAFDNFISAGGDQSMVPTMDGAYAVATGLSGYLSS